MTIFIEVKNWIEKLVVRQQHAVTVLYESTPSSADDLKHPLALLQNSHEISNVIGRYACKRTKEQVAAPQVDQPLVQVTTIKNLQRVNALAPGKTLPLAPTGQTSIYGHNGADKVGLHPRIEEGLLRTRPDRAYLVQLYKHLADQQRTHIYSQILGREMQIIRASIALFAQAMD